MKTLKQFIQEQLVKKVTLVHYRYPNHGWVKIEKKLIDALVQKHGSMVSKKITAKSKTKGSNVYLYAGLGNPLNADHGKDTDASEILSLLSKSGVNVSIKKDERFSKVPSFLGEATIAVAKITGELYKRLETACKSVIKSNGFDSFSALHAHYKKMGIGKNPSVRARWDVFNAIHSNIKRDLVDDLYKVGNDTHIDTALKRITGIK